MSGKGYFQYALKTRVLTTNIERSPCRRKEIFSISLIEREKRKMGQEKTEIPNLM
jgi:hypothetical protein